MYYDDSPSTNCFPLGYFPNELHTLFLLQLFSSQQKCNSLFHKRISLYSSFEVPCCNRGCRDVQRSAALTIKGYTYRESQMDAEMICNIGVVCKELLWKKQVQKQRAKNHSKKGCRNSLQSVAVLKKRCIYSMQKNCSGKVEKCSGMQRTAVTKGVEIACEGLWVINPAVHQQG